MIDYRTYLTGLVAVFLALGLGMLIGSALVGAPSTVRQQRDLRALQQNFTDFNQKYADARTQADNLKARLAREDQALRQVLPSLVANRLPNRHVAIVVCGELDDTGFLNDLDDVLDQAGATVVTTTRVSDDWIPSEASARSKVVASLEPDGADPSDAGLTKALGRALVTSRDDTLNAASGAATGLRLDGDYSQPVNVVLLISGTRTPDRLEAAKAGTTPETPLIAGFQSAATRLVAAEPDGDEAATTIPLWSRAVPATVDNIDMAAGQIAAVYALAGHDGHFGIKRGAERALPEPDASSTPR